MKTLLLLAIAIVVVLTIPSLCIAQKCYVITKDTFVFASPYTAYHWAMMSDKETANNFLDRLQDTKEVIYERREKGTKVYKIDKKNFPGGLVMDEIANFSTKKSMGWIFGWDVKDNLKPCK